MRKLPTEVPLPVSPDFRHRRVGSKTMAYITQIRQYELITPLFGGGVEPAGADPVTIIRGTEIRGHLRFWWRACRGGQFKGSLKNMKKAEDKLWGAASTAKKPAPSQVQVFVQIINRGKKDKPFETKTGPYSYWRNLAYAAFPLQEKQGSVLTGVKFSLTITFPENKQMDVEAALWAWETFGGIGARTRRGFGALRLVRVDNKDSVAVSNVNNLIREGLNRYVVQGQWPSGVPHLTRLVRFKVTRKFTDETTAPFESWKYMVKKLQDFRQARRGKFGRSLWPEPDEIRRRTNRKSRKHTKALSEIRKFPRAQFGLPIVFHFKDEGAGDPHDTTLQGRVYERLASPLIIRPLMCANGQAVGLALILDGTDLPPGGLKLKGAHSDFTVEGTLTAAEAGSITPLRGKVNVLQAFLDRL